MKMKKEEEVPDVKIEGECEINHRNIRKIIRKRKSVVEGRGRVKGERRT